MKDYSDYTLAGDEKLTISAQEFVALQKGLSQAMENGVIAQHPQVLKWYNVETSEEVKEPTQKQIESGKVRQFADPDATESQENLQISYNANIFPHTFSANRVIMEIFQRHVDEGVIPTIEEVKKKYEERNAEGQMKVVSEDEE